MSDAPARAFVCGHPISHSRSPLIHRFWLGEFGLAGHYEPIDVAPAKFAEFFAGMVRQGWCGGNVTIPHKPAAFDLVDQRDSAAEKIGSVNTLWIEGGRIIGGNTDAHGFAANLDAHSNNWRNAGTAVVLGAGGAARAVVCALQDAGIPAIRVVNRNKDRVDAISARFGGMVSGHAWGELNGLLAGANLLVNTTSLGMKGQPSLDIDLSLLPGGALVTDIVYTPLETPFLRQARLLDLVAIDGLGMLLHQAAPGFERWFGKKPIVSDRLRAYIVSDLEMIR